VASKLNSPILCGNLLEKLTAMPAQLRCGGALLLLTMLALPLAGSANTRGLSL
jgi:hypothetical protein